MKLCGPSNAAMIGESCFAFSALASSSLISSAGSRGSLMLMKSQSRAIFPAIPMSNTWGQLEDIKTFNPFVGVLPLFLIVGTNQYLHSYSVDPNGSVKRTYGNKSSLSCGGYFVLRAGNIRLLGCDDILCLHNGCLPDINTYLYNAADYESGGQEGGNPVGQFEVPKGVRGIPAAIGWFVGCLMFWALVRQARS